MPTRTRFQPALILSILAVAALLLSACGARPFGGAAAPQESASFAEAPAADFSGEGAVASVQDSMQQAPGSGGTNALLNRKMIARATLSLFVADTEKTVEAVESLVTEAGGFVSAASFYNQTVGEQEMMRGTMTLRVPAEALDGTLDALEALAMQVGERTVSREDVTDQYVDLDAQLRNLTATEDELREMLAEVRAKPNASPEDILAVHTRLMEIRGQIEQVQGRKNMLDNLIGLSTIDLSLVPDASMLPVVDEGWRPLVVLREAARALVGSLQGLGNFAIWFFVYVLPIVLIIAVPFVIFGLIMRRVLRRRRAAVQASAN